MALNKLTDIRKSLSVEVEDLQVNGISTFSGTVSIGGTLTYQDVTNINSVGLITARGGIFLPDNNKAEFGNVAGNANLEIYHDGSNHSYVRTVNSSAGGIIIKSHNDLQIRTDNFQLKTNALDDVLTSDVVGNVSIGNSLTVAGISTFHDAIKLKADVTGGSSTNRLYIGAGDDLTLFHDTTNSYIQNHTGDLIIGDTNHIYLRGYTSDKSAGLWFNNSEKIRTTNTGAVVSGILTATSFAPTAVTAQLSHRNILHNGEFKVIQRYGTSFTINSDADNEFTIDRWYVATNNNLGNFTVSQEADAPAGFRTSVKIQCTSTDTSSSGSEQSFIQQTVEAQNVSHIFNGSSSQPMTLSFYYKSNATTTRQLWFYTPDTTRHYSAIFTPSATNTWERFTIPIPADTANTINDDTGGGFYVRFMIAAGTVYKNSRPTSWVNLSNDRYSGVTNLTTNTANNFYITGVQLEMGSVATPYEHRTVSEELVNCQRYYYPYKSILKGSSSGVDRPWIPVQLFLNSSSNNDAFVVIAGLNEQRAKMRTGSAEVRVLSPLNSAPITTYPSAGEWAYFYRGQGSGFSSGGTAFTWNDGYYNMYGVKSSAQPRPTQIMIETNSEVGKVYVELDDEI